MPQLMINVRYSHILHSTVQPTSFHGKACEFDSHQLGLYHQACYKVDIIMQKDYPFFSKKIRMELKSQKSCFHPFKRITHRYLIVEINHRGKIIV
jgi:hypothetical protein